MNKKFKMILKIIIPIILLLTISFFYSFIFNSIMALADIKGKDNICPSGCFCSCECCLIKEEEEVLTEIHFIDVGNADSIFIKGEKNILIDGGEDKHGTIISEYLKSLGVTTIDYVIGSHAHSDHVGGLDVLIYNFNVKNVFTSNTKTNTKVYQDFLYAASSKKVYASVPLENTIIPLGESSSMKFFNTNGGSTINNQSLIMLYEDNGTKVLFTGDIEEQAENEVLELMEDIDILKVSHHGSENSSTLSFLEKVKAEIGIISTGIGNSYNHPHKLALDRLKQTGVEIHRTDEKGTIILNIYEDGYKIK